jgi:hypothetical protein
MLPSKLQRCLFLLKNLFIALTGVPLQYSSTSEQTQIPVPQHKPTPTTTIKSEDKYAINV